MRREVVVVHDGLVELKTPFPKIPFPKTPQVVASLSHLGFSSVVRRDGTVVEAYLHNELSGATTRLALAGPGDYSYVGEGAFMTLPVPEVVTTRKGSYTINQVIVSRQNVAMPGVQSSTTSVWYYDPGVKFGLVRQYNLTESDASIVEVAGFINTISPMGQLYRSLNSFIIEKSRHHTYSSRMDLVESN